MTIELKLAPSEVFGEQMQDVIKIRRGAKATIINALVKGIGTATDLIDMTDSRGAGNPNSVVSLTNALVNPFAGRAVNYNATQLYDGVNAFGEDISNLKIESGNTGCPTDIFAWTGYKF